jgi:hypothetical protein
MESKHEQLYVAVQDLLIELGITPEELRSLALNKRTRNTTYEGTITPKMAQKLIDAGLIVEEINWRRPGNVADFYYQKIEDPLPGEIVFNKIKSGLTPNILWKYLREQHEDFLLAKLNGI